LIILPGVVLAVRYFSAKLHILTQQGMEQQARISSQFQESLSSVSLIKAFASEARAVRQLMSALRRAFHISLEQTTVGSVANLTISAMPGIARAGVLALGAYWVIQDQWTLGSLLAFQAYLGYVSGPAQFLATSNLELQKALAALRRVSALIAIVPEENIWTGQRVDRLTGDVSSECPSYDERPCPEGRLVSCQDWRTAVPTQRRRQDDPKPHPPFLQAHGITLDGLPHQNMR
jgi:ABC-type bacteriocin/lantibiotic exporter with double-glycine peptidase domain